jgi:Ca-activated chloride channel family protein
VSYLAPHWLWLLGVVALLAVLYGVLQWRRRSTFTVRFTNLDLLDSVAPKRPGWRRHLVAGLLLVALAVLVVALARPTRPEAAPLGPVLVLAIDTSLSMEATDVDPNRIEAAQEAADGLVEGLTDNVRVGLVSFDNGATIQVTPTTDHDAVRDAIDGLELDEFTAIGEAIFAGLDAIEIAEQDQPEPAADATADEPPPSQIVLMSDGETTTGRPDVDRHPRPGPGGRVGQRAGPAGHRRLDQRRVLLGHHR